MILASYDLTSGFAVRDRIDPPTFWKRTQYRQRQFA
jgi:hypothetical protein